VNIITRIHRVRAHQAHQGSGLGRGCRIQPIGEISATDILLASAQTRNGTHCTDLAGRLEPELGQHRAERPFILPRSHGAHPQRSALHTQEYTHRVGAGMLTAGAARGFREPRPHPNAAGRKPGPRLCAGSGETG